MYFSHLHKRFPGKLPRNEMLQCAKTTSNGGQSFSIPLYIPLLRMNYSHTQSYFILYSASYRVVATEVNTSLRCR